MDPVPAPVVVEDPRELRQIAVDEFFWRHRIADRMIPTLAARTRRPGDVLQHRQILDRADQPAEQNAAEREPETRDRRGSRDLGLAAEREHEAVGAGAQEHVLIELRMRREHAESRHEREYAPRPLLAVAHAPVECQQHQREERRDEELAVVSRRDESRDRTAHHEREPTDERRPERHAVRPQEREREDAAEEQMEDHSPRHADVHRQEQSEQEGRVEDVAVHRGDVWHAAEEVRVPECESTGVLHHLRRERSHGKPADILVADGAHQEAAEQCGPGEGECGDGIHQRRPKSGTPGGRRRDLVGNHPRKMPQMSAPGNGSAGPILRTPTRLRPTMRRRRGGRARRRCWRRPRH